MLSARRVLIVIGILSLTACAWGATYYMSPTGNDTSGNGSSGSPWATTTKAFSSISAGDTLIVKDGTYHQTITNPPSGTSLSNMTKIKAEHDGLAIFEMTTASMLLYFYDVHYVQVEGFKFIESAVNSTADLASLADPATYNKILRCAFVKNPTTTNDNCTLVDVSGNHNLLEDCWAWGGGRYKFLVYGGDSIDTGSYNILRRCVARHDREYSGGYNPQAAFCNYQGANNLFQNCIIVDSNYPCSWESSHSAQPYYDSWRGPFFMEKGQKAGFVKMEGCIALGFSGCFVTDDPYDGTPANLFTPGALTISNCVAINGYNGIPIGSHYSNRPIVVDHCVLANLSGVQEGDYQSAEFAFTGGDTSNSQSTATNSIFYGMTSSAYGGGGGLLRVAGANDYNSFYNNTSNRTNSTTGTHDITNVNPTAASLKYPVRIENGSALSGAGSAGSDIGPDITTKIGVSGTLYGETGYDTVTVESLWPFPNEDRIKSDMSSYPSNWPAGNLPSPTRGFCASSESLTHYIMNYLGNGDPYSTPVAPDAPSDLIATAQSSSTVSLEWTDNSNNEAGFKIERSTVSGSNYSQIYLAGANNETYTNTGLNPSTTYYYRIRATNAIGDSANSNVSSALTFSVSFISAPSNLTATAISTSSINLTWKDNSNNETGFKIERSTVSGSDYSEIGTRGANITAYADSGLDEATTYYYRVRATNAIGDSAYSNEAYTLTFSVSFISAPSNLTATAISTSSINLTWKDNSNNETGFKIERSTVSGSDYSEIGTRGANITAYADSGLDEATTYYYRVRATNGIVNSAYSNESFAFTYVLSFVYAPSNLTATAISASSINLAWTDNSNNETGFKIERSTISGNNYSQIGTKGANITAYADTGLNPLTTYYYRVKATNAIVDSTYSNESYAVTYSVSYFYAPSNLSAIAVSSFCISLSWSDNSSIESGFKIERKRTGSYSQIATVGPNVTTYLNTTGLVANTTYYYRIRAASGTVNTSYSNVSSAVTYSATFIFPPSNLNPAAVSFASISLAWTDNSNNETGFKIERSSVSNNNYSQIGTQGANITTYSDSGLDQSTIYYYRVRATNAAADSVYSNVMSTVTLATPVVTGGGNGNNGGTSVSENDAKAMSRISSGEIIIIGSTKNRGTVNPDEGDTAKIYFKGSGTGKYDCRIFSLTGEMLWQDTKENISSGTFEWIPKDIASGGYVVSVKGPGLNVKKKIAILR